MGEIQFENESSTFKSRRVFGEPETPKMIKGIMRILPIKSEQQAGHILMGIAALGLIASIFIIYNATATPTPGEFVVNTKAPDAIRNLLPR
jgi:hypothetical protein